MVAEDIYCEKCNVLSDIENSFYGFLLLSNDKAAFTVRCDKCRTALGYTIRDIISRENDGPVLDSSFLASSMHKFDFIEHKDDWHNFANSSRLLNQLIHMQKYLMDFLYHFNLAGVCRPSFSYFKNNISFAKALLDEEGTKNTEIHWEHLDECKQALSKLNQFILKLGEIDISKNFAQIGEGNSYTSSNAYQFINSFTNDLYDELLRCFSEEHKTLDEIVGYSFIDELNSVLISCYQLSGLLLMPKSQFDENQQILTNSECLEFIPSKICDSIWPYVDNNTSSPNSSEFRAFKKEYTVEEDSIYINEEDEICDKFAINFIQKKLKVNKDTVEFLVSEMSYPHQIDEFGIKVFRLYIFIETFFKQNQTVD